MIYFDESHLLFSDKDTLALQRLSTRTRSAGGWIIGERFDDRFDTQVGGFLHIAKQWIDAGGQLQGDWKRTSSGDIETVRAASLIVDYANGGKSYTEEEAAKLPEMAGVLARLREREAGYVAFLAEKAAANARYEARKRVREAEFKKRHARFLPQQVLKRAYSNAGL